MAHYFPYDVKLGLLADSQSFLANQKARNAIVGVENLLNKDIIASPDKDDPLKCQDKYMESKYLTIKQTESVLFD